MICLTREIRFSLIADESSPESIPNSWGGWPAASEIAPSMTLHCSLVGSIDPVSGYLCNIKLIDDALRQHVIVPLCQTNAEGVARFHSMSCEQLVQFAWDQMAIQFSSSFFPANCQLRQIKLGVTPTLNYTRQEIAEQPNRTQPARQSKSKANVMNKNEALLQLTQEFEFSASHRLHNPSLSDEENRNLFGKCNNPHGHGHNYTVMVTVQGTPGENGRIVSLQRFEAMVKERVIDRMDHRNLNVELEEFADLNPSVENIAIVVWRLIDVGLDTIGGENLSLSKVRVYETPKTWADFYGPG